MRLVIYLRLANLLKFEAAAADSSISPTQQLQSQLQMHLVEDCFQRLGLEYSAAAEDVVAAHAKYRELLAPGTAAYQADPKVAQQILQVLEEAANFLSTTTGRQEQRNRILKTSQRTFLVELVANQIAFAKLYGDTARADKLTMALADLGI